MNTRDVSKHLFLLAFGLALNLVSAAQAAGTAAEFNKGKTIRIVAASQPADRFS